MSLAAVAQAVNMSASYFSEKFKEITGLNFVAYVARTRIEKARNLLHNPNLRISEIAFEVGFQSLSQFNRAFKQVTGRARANTGSPSPNSSHTCHRCPPPSPRSAEHSSELPSG